jgi:iron complex transport system substrate-binding protein
MSLILVTGGARAGKSTFAQNLARRIGGRDICYLATAEAGDDEMRTRIAAHQADRPAGWVTVEAPRNVAAALEALAARPRAVLLDCLTLLVSNILVVLLPLTAGCGSAPGDPQPAAPAENGFPLTVTDALDRTVTIPRRPARIVSLAPSVTETLFAVGAGSRVVAVTTTDTYPSEVKELPTVGGFSPETISTEAILALQPDLVLAGGRFQKPIVDTVARLGPAVVVIEPATLAEVQEAITLVGRATGQDSQAAALVADFRRRLDAARRRAAASEAKAPPRVLYVLWDDPLQTAGSRTFVGQMISAAGGVNLLADAGQAYPQVSDEAVLARNPDLILAPDHGAVGLPERLGKRPGWARLKAVRKGRVVTVPEDLLNRPGPRLIAGLEAIERLLLEVKDLDRP